MANKNHTIEVDELSERVSSEVMVAAATAGCSLNGRAKKLTHRLGIFRLYQIDPVSNDWVMVWEGMNTAAAADQYNHL